MYTTTTVVLSLQDEDGITSITLEITSNSVKATDITGNAQQKLYKEVTVRKNAHLNEEKERKLLKKIIVSFRDPETSLNGTLERGSQLRLSLSSLPNKHFYEGRVVEIDFIRVVTR